jgi:hypothetical protein
VKGQNVQHSCYPNYKIGRRIAIGIDLGGIFKRVSNIIFSRKNELDTQDRIIPESLPDIFTAQIKIGKSVSAAVIELVNDADRQGAQNLERETKNKIFFIVLFSYQWPHHKGQDIHKYQKNRSDEKVLNLHPP